MELGVRVGCWGLGIGLWVRGQGSHPALAHDGGATFFFFFVTVRSNCTKQGLQGYLAHKNPPPPEDHNKALCILLLQVVSEVPLHSGDTSHVGIAGVTLHSHVL